MRFQRSVVVGFTIATLAFISGIVLTRSAMAQGATRTVWDGVYTSEQANRGQDIYDKRCTECHQDDLSGGGDDAAAVLRGADFLARWNGKPVAELFRTIGNSMPRSAPGSLSPGATTDVIAFLLKKNQVPASDSEMAADATKLEHILITDKPR